MQLQPSTEKILVAHSAEEYLQLALQMLLPVANASFDMICLRRDVCEKVERVFSNKDTLEEWNGFLAQVVKHS